MAAPLPNQTNPVAGEGGGLHRNFREPLQDWRNRIGGGKDLTFSADDTGLLVTYRIPDGTPTGTVHTLTVPWDT